MNRFTMTAAPFLNIEATATFHPVAQLSLQEVQLRHFKAGPNEFQGSLIKSSHNHYLVTVHGKLLDLEPFIKNTSDQEVQFPKETMDIKVTFDQLRLDAEHAFFANTLSFRLQNERIQALQFKSYLKSLRRKEDLMFAFIESYPGHRRRFTFQTPAAGKLLKAFNTPIQVQDGFLQLYAFKNDADSNNPWRGKFRIQNFRVKNVPTLAKVLSYAFPTGLADLSSKGLFFQQVRSNFVLTPQKLFLTKGRMQGNSLGMTVRGNVGRGSTQDLHLTGSVIPGYVINSSLPKIIPFLGEILTGGKHEGIFSVSYTIEGTRSDPQVSINPISLFTPGFLRRLFDWNSDADEESEDDIEDVDSLSPQKAEDKERCHQVN